MREPYTQLVRGVGDGRTLEPFKDPRALRVAALETPRRGTRATKSIDVVYQLLDLRARVQRNGTVRVSGRVTRGDITRQEIDAIREPRPTPRTA
jgi:hypothetical protein